MQLIYFVLLIAGIGAAIFIAVLMISGHKSEMCYNHSALLERNTSIEDARDFIATMELGAYQEDRHGNIHSLQKVLMMYSRFRTDRHLLHVYEWEYLNQQHETAREKFIEAALNPNDTQITS